MWSGTRRQLVTASTVAQPVTVALLQAMVAQLPAGARGARDRALLLVGFAIALRRSELVALDTADVDPRPEGLVVTVRDPNHSHATDLIRRGVPIEIVSKRLTHASVATTSQTYLHLSAADVAAGLVRAGVWPTTEARP